MMKSLVYIDRSERYPIFLYQHPENDTMPYVIEFEDYMIERDKMIFISELHSIKIDIENIIVLTIDLLTWNMNILEEIKNKKSVVIIRFRHLFEYDALECGDIRELIFEIKKKSIVIVQCSEDMHELIKNSILKNCFAVEMHLTNSEYVSIAYIKYLSQHYAGISELSDEVLELFCKQKLYRYLTFRELNDLVIIALFDSQSKGREYEKVLVQILNNTII